MASFISSFRSGNSRNSIRASKQFSSATALVALNAGSAFTAQKFLRLSTLLIDAVEHVGVEVDGIVASIPRVIDCLLSAFLHALTKVQPASQVSGREITGVKVAKGRGIAGYVMAFPAGKSSDRSLCLGIEVRNSAIDYCLVPSLICLPSGLLPV
jgi:hypothetical protein